LEARRAKVLRASVVYKGKRCGAFLWRLMRIL